MPYTSLYGENNNTFSIKLKIACGTNVMKPNLIFQIKVSSSGSIFLHATTNWNVNIVIKLTIYYIVILFGEFKLIEYASNRLSVVQKC